MKTFAERLKFLRKQRKLTQESLADLLNVSRGAVANWEVGAEIARENILGISQEFDVSLDWLERGTGKGPTVTNGQALAAGGGIAEDYPANGRMKTEPAGRWKEIPVYGQAVAGVDGEFVMNGSVLFTALAPPSVVAIAKAYGVRVAGISMEPRYFDGEVVFVDPSRTPRTGDFVVVQIRLEEHGELLGYVKRYVRRNTKELVLKQFNPEKELVFPHTTVESVHVIVMGGMG